MIRVLFIGLIALATSLSALQAGELRSGFVYLDEIDKTILVDLKYFSKDNFVGKKVDGYKGKRAIMTEAAAKALKLVQDDLRKQGYGLKVFDAYRPQQAVNHFVRWTRDRRDLRTKAEYYPSVPKSTLLSGGYISSRSRHSSGSTIDLTLVNLKTGKEVDMGTPFDYFGNESAHGTGGVTKEQARHRKLLRSSMENRNFRAYYKEWWHYTLRNEPFAGQYFDFPVQ